MDIKNIAKHKLHMLMTVCFLMLPAQQALASATGASGKGFPDSSTYAGVDAGLISEMTKSTYGFQENNGKNAYSKNPLLYGVFLGHKFNDRFGFEVAYETQQKKNKTVQLEAGDTIPGAAPGTFSTLTAGEWFQYKTTNKTQHFQAALHITLHEFDKKENINIWAQIGGSYSQLRAEQVALAGVDGGAVVAADDLANMRRTFKQWKLIPMAKLGVHYNWTSRIGLRATIGWRELSLLKPKSKEAPTASTQIKLKDGFNCGVGFYFKL